jgi:hypothetical protein
MTSRWTHRVLAVVVAVAGAVSTGCESDIVDPAPDFDPASTSIEVRYTDSSVPPEYHRSWTLTGDDRRATAEVDSYGEIVARERATMPASLWQDLMEPLREIAGMSDVAPDDGCDGGTAIAVTVRQAGDPQTTSVERCGDEGAEEMDQILGLLAPVTDLVELDRLTAT